MPTRPAVLLTLSSDGNRPLWSYPHTGTLPRPISFVCHSYENTRGVGVSFPFWNGTCGIGEGNSLYDSSSFFSHSCALLRFLALFCTHQELNLFLFNRFRTLGQKTGGHILQVKDLSLSFHCRPFSRARIRSATRRPVHLSTYPAANPQDRPVDPRADSASAPGLEFRTPRAGSRSSPVHHARDPSCPGGSGSS